MSAVVDLAERSSWVRHLGQMRDLVARAATEALVARHPDRPQRQGAGARAIGIEEAGVHIDFLMGAVAAASPEAFADYARWSTRSLEARGSPSYLVAESIREIRDQLSLALPESTALIAEVANAGIESCTSPAPPPDEWPPSSRAQRLFTRAAVRGDRQAAAAIAAATLHDGTCMLDLFTDVFEASQREVGRLWERNQISVAEEHMATAVTQYAMARVFGEAPLAHPARGRVVVTGVKGELHQLGANMVADVLALDGWDVQFLGTNVPEQDILSAVDRLQPSILAISATVLSSLPEALSLIEAVRKGLGPSGPSILVGGAAFNCTSDIFREMGCDGYAPDLQSARVLVDRLFPVTPSVADSPGAS